MPLLLSVCIAEGSLAARPAAGISGRLYFCTDTKAFYRDNGASWDNYTPGSPAAILLATPSAAGPYALPHGLSSTPSRISIVPTSAGSIWQATAPDATNINLFASDPDITATIYVFA
jgi:hypothetical protein